MVDETNDTRNQINCTSETVQPISQVSYAVAVEHDLSITCENLGCLSKIPEYFHLWLNIGYFGLCIPFKPTLERNSRTHKLQSNKLQKVE